MSNEMTLEALEKKRNKLLIQLKLNKLRNVGELVKIKQEIARKKTKKTRSKKE
jgi:hypothetical protein